MLTATQSTSSSQSGIKLLFQTALESSCFKTKGAGHGNPDCLVEVILAVSLCWHTSETGKMRGWCLTLKLHLLLPVLMLSSFAWHMI